MLLSQPRGTPNLRLEIDEYVFDIARQVSRSLGDELDTATIRWVNPSLSKKRVNDATLAFYLDGKAQRNDIVLLISNPSYPNSVMNDVSRARRIARILSPAVASRISSPIYEGKYGEQTFAAFSRLSPLSNYRLIRIMQREMAVKSILPWLIEFALETQVFRTTSGDIERYYERPLLAICEDQDMSKEITSRARTCLNLVRDKNPKLFTSAQHGDFWIGNIFFRKRALQSINPILGDFTVIDWGGSRLHGYPCIDCLRLCTSLYRLGSSRTRNFTSAYNSAMKISALEYQLYCLSALGKLSMDLDQFPKEHFIALCDNVLKFIDDQIL